MSFPGYDGAGSGLIGISMAFVEFAIFIIALTYIMTWVFNNTRGSLLLPMVLPTSLNTVYYYIHSTQFITLSKYLCCVVVALLIIAATRGRLGYQREQQPAPAHLSA